MSSLHYIAVSASNEILLLQGISLKYVIKQIRGAMAVEVVKMQSMWESSFLLKEGEAGSWDWNALGWEERDSDLPQGMMGYGYRDGVTHPGEGMGTGKNIS